MKYKQIDHYSEVLEKLEDVLGELNKADLHFGLTDLQGQSQIQLRVIYDTMIGDLLDLEHELL